MSDSTAWTIDIVDRVIKAARRVANVEIGALHNPDGYGMSTVYDRDRGAAMDELIAAIREHDNPPDLTGLLLADLREVQPPMLPEEGPRSGY